jgi:hypothetical protein
VLVRKEAGDEAQQTNGARRCRRFGLRDFIFSNTNGVVCGFMSRLDFSISNTLFDFGNFRFLQGQFIVSGLAGGAFGVRQTARAESFDKPIELLFVFKRRHEMSVDLLMSSHFLAVECHAIFFPGAEDGSFGNLIGRLLFFGINF